MDLLITVLLLLICLLISNVISHYIPFIPTALIQIVLGIVIELTFLNIKVELETDWFLLLFVAPLLYNDGRHFPRKELWRMKSPIIGNAIVLVLLTAIGGGYFIHWMIPDIPLAAAFALAGILSPTDPVAVNGIARHVHIPERVLYLVRGESLINDASGLIAFHYAVAAVITGYFSLKGAVFDFSYTMLAGAAAGLIFGLLFTWIRYTLRIQGVHDVTFHSLLQVLTPFIIYIITEEFLHASGVIAVVVAGIMHSLIEERTGTLAAEEKIVTENVWSMVLFALNGIVFILLGLNTPSSMMETVANPNIGNWLAIGYVAVIGLVIVAIRFLWSCFFSFYQYHAGKTKGAHKPSFKISLLVSFTGVRGTVTMAGALSIPYVLMNGDPFPERSLILFLAAGVILFTLIAATIVLPLLCKERTSAAAPGDQTDLAEAKRKIILGSIHRLELGIDEENRFSSYELINEYRRMLEKLQFEQNSEGISEYQRKIAEIRLIGLKAERKCIREMLESGLIDEKAFETFERSLDYREEILSNDVRNSAKIILGRTLRGLYRFKGRRRGDEKARRDKLRQGKDIQLKASMAARESLLEYKKESQRAEDVNTVILDYDRMIGLLKTTRAQYYEAREEQKEELRLKAMDFERHEIFKMYEAGEISNEQAKELRRFVNYVESAALYEYSE